MGKETDLLDEIKDNRTFAETELTEQRAEAAKDRLCAGGQVWEAMDPDAVRERKSNKRPWLNSDLINQYLNQVINNVRANPRGIKYAPTGNGANDKGAEFYQNHVREIEYRSKASMVYAHAFEDAVTSGVGWLRIKTKREHVRTFNQDLWIEMVANADQVLPDPSGVWSDSRDIKFLLYIEPWPRSAFEQKFPKAKATNFNFDIAKLAPQWLTREIVQVGEYWKLESLTRRLIAYKPTGADDSAAQFVLKDELLDDTLPEGTENIREDDVEDTKVRCWLTNGLEILKEQKWLGKYIPFVSCYGKVLYINGKKVVLSMTRLARDPAMYHAYALTCGAEAIGGIPRAQWVGYEGQFAKPERWAKSNHQPVAFLEGKATVPGNPNPNQALPLPQKQSWDPPIQNIEMVIEARGRSVQSAMGILPQPTDAQRQNDVSGVAYQERQAQGQLGSLHFGDAYDLMIERTGMILEDCMDKYVDTARDMPVRLPGDKAAIVRVNDPTGSEYNGQHQLGGDPLYTKGDYRCTVSTGPADASQRQAADDFVNAMVSNLQTIAQLAGPERALKLLAKSVSLKQLGPIGDEIVEMFDPPELGADGQPLPPQVAQLLGQNKQLQKIVQQMQQEKAGKVTELQGKMAITQVQEQHEDTRAAMDREVKIAVAEIAAQAKQALQDMALFYEERARLGAHLHEQAMGSQDAVRASALAHHVAALDSAQSTQDHVEHLTEAAQAHQHSLAAGQQAAALAPEPAQPEAGA